MYGQHGIGLMLTASEAYLDTTVLYVTIGLSLSAVPKKEDTRLTRIYGDSDMRVHSRKDILELEEVPFVWA